MPRTCRLRGESPRQALAQLGSLIQRSTADPFERINLTAPTCQVELGQERLTYAVQDVAGEFVADRTNPTLAARLPSGRAGSRGRAAS